MDSQAAVERLVAFYVEQHNSVMPHSALGGLTPDEFYFGRSEGVREQLAEAWRKARTARLAANQAASCGACLPAAEPEACPETPMLPCMLQLHTQESRRSA